MTIEEAQFKLATDMATIQRLEGALGAWLAADAGKKTRMKELAASGGMRWQVLR